MLKLTVMDAFNEYTVTAGRILTEAGLQRGKALVIRDGYVVKICDSGLITDRMKTYAFDNAAVVPFLCDHHIHFFRNALDGTLDVGHELLSSGIGEVYDGGSGDLSNLEVKSLLEGVINIKTSGFGIYKNGKYGKLIGRGVDIAKEAESLIDELIKVGVDFIKVVNSGIYDPESGSISEGGFSAEELEFIVGHAKSRGVDVHCHANGKKAVRDAVNAGITTLIHGLHVCDETLSIMRDKEVAFIPTVNAFASLKMIAESKQAKELLEKTVEIHNASVARAAAKGVIVLAGSDAGASFIPYGKSLYDELSFFKQAELSYEQILSAASSSCLREGERADFIVLEELELRKVVLKGKLQK